MAAFLIAALAARAGASYLSSRSRNQQQRRDRQAQINARNIDNQQREDQRRARLALGASLLNGVPSTTGDGSIRTNVGVDPALFAQLDRPRKYDYSSTVASPGGIGQDFLAGLLGGAGDVAGYMGSRDSGPNSIVSPSGASSSMSGGPGTTPPVGAQGATGAPGTASGSTVSLDDLMKLLGLNYSSGPGSPTGD